MIVQTQSLAGHEIPEQKGSAVRCFRVLEALLKLSPMNRAQISEFTGLNKSAIHRSLHLLIEMGWVRMSLCRTKYFIASSAEELIVNADFPLPEIDTRVPHLKDIADVLKLHVDISVLEGPGNLRLVESSDTGLEPALYENRQSFVWSDMAIVVLSAMNEAKQKRHLASYLETASSEERRETETQSFSSQLSQAAEDGFLLNLGSPSVSIPLIERQNNSVLGAVRFRPYPSYSNRQIENHLYAAVKLLKESEVFRDLT